MKNFRDYLKESEEAADNPITGDVFAVNFREEYLVESVVLEHAEDGVVIAADDRMLEIFESYGITLEDVCMECGVIEGNCGCVHEEQVDEFAPVVGAIARTVARNAIPAAMIASMGDDDTNEGRDPGEYGEEGDMAKNELLTIIRAARKLTGMLDTSDDMPEWTQKKINKAADYVDTAADYISSQKERGIMEQPDDGNPVARAVLHRIMMQHPGVLATHGPERVMAAVDELADRVNIGPDDEIGTSDVSGWTRDVIRMLAELPDEPMNVGDALDETTHAEMRNAAGLTQTEWMQKLRAAGGKIVAQAKMPNGPVIGMLNGKRVAWRPAETNPAHRQQQPGDKPVQEDSPIRARLRQEMQKAMDRFLDPVEYQHQQTIRQQDREYELSAGTEKRADLKQIADELAEIKRQQLRKEALEDVELAFQRAETRAQREAEMEKIKRQYQHDLDLINTNHRTNLEAIRTGNDHEIRKMDREYQHEKDMWNMKNPSTRPQRPARRPDVTIDLDIDEPAQEPDQGSDDGEFEKQRQDIFRLSGLPLAAPAPTAPKKPKKFDNTDAVDADVKEPDNKRPGAPGLPGPTNEDLQADSGERYRSADDFFSQFEADWFDEEQVSDDGMEIRGYIDGVNVMVWRYDSPRKTTGYGVYDDSQLSEAKYQGRDVPLGKPMRGDVKKFKVFVKDPKTGNVKKVNFGDPNMRIKKSNPARRKSFRARHNCDNPGPRTKARYWSCRAW